MMPYTSSASDRQRMRRDLLRQYLLLQRDLVEGDPGSEQYQSTIHAFRQMGYTLISAGFEEDLDRLLRLRVMDGGRAMPLPPEERSARSDVCVVEKRIL